MSKKLFYFACLVLLLGAVANTYAADPNAEIPKLGAAPGIDGELDSIWLFVEEHKMSNYISTAGALMTTPLPETDLSGSWRAIWDDQNLYVFFDVKDQALYGDSTTLNDRYNDDSVEVFLDIGKTGGTAYAANHFHYRWSYDPANIAQGFIGDDNGRSIVGIVAAWKLTGTGYRVEIKIPWSTVSPTKTPVLGDIMGLEMQFNDDDNAGARDNQLTWIVTTNNTWSNPSLMGTVVFTLGSFGTAMDPYPSDKAEDVEKNVILHWTPGLSANTHNVFFSTDINDVNNATIANPLGVTISAGQPLDVNYFNPGTLEVGKTYYWRVDEVNAPSKPGTNKGLIWQFTVEPVALKVPAANIKATAKHSASNNDPNNTINEKGFKDANHPDWHDISLGMWLSGKTDVNNPVWIMYEFSELYKIHEMFVWNHNAKIGTGKSGFKSTIIEYSEDGQAWTQLTTTQFNRGPGRIDYVYNTTVPFNGAVAKYVRITALSNWNGDQNGSGLSEVRFTYIPVRARKPSPDTGSVNVPLNRILTWRAGREAVTHNVYISTNEQAVTGRSSGVHTVSQAAYSPSSLELNRTYYWRVDEVNTSDVPSLWESDVWSFSTPAYILVEGFETGYDNSDANAVWATWTGWEDLTNGGAMGNASAPYLSTTNHSGGHSSPMFYNNGKPGVVKSEVIAQAANLPIGTTNWTLGNPDTLVIWFRGDPNNPVTDKMYVKLNSTKVIYNGGVSDITRTAWTKWEVPLTGINLGNISSLTIGMEKIGSTGGSGVLYLDDIQLTISVPASDPGTANLVAKYNMENNVQDSSGHNLNGTLKGTVNGGPTYQAGIYGQALVFDGNDDCVDLGKNAAFNPTGSFSVSLWAKITTWSSSYGHVMVGNRGEDNVGWQIRRYSDNRFSFTTRGISNDDMNSSANAPLNEWVNITCVYDSAARTKSIYINGALERSVNMTGTVTQIPATTHNTYIGARANSANTGQEGFFAGMLDKILIYDKALSEGEVEYIYKN